MLKNLKNRIFAGIVAIFIGFSTLSLQSCDDPIINELVIEILASMVNGWLMENEELDNIPSDIVVVDVDETDMKPYVDISDKFPPIGDQGNYGTCVAWAAGYGLKTALNAIDNGWSSYDLSQTKNQTSPSDLWYAIPSDKKGSGCNGTNFEPALNAIIQTGVASLSQVPYNKLSSSCSGSAKGSSSNKLSNFRKIADDTKGRTPENFKYYLNQGRPIVFGARLGDRFMSWSSSSVLNYDTYLSSNAQHAYHALVLVGYDDNRRAFRVRNSWGTAWGDNGSIWVDYNFFVNDFMFAAFVAQNVSGKTVENDQISNDDLATGYDLMAYSFKEFDNEDSDNILARRFVYEVYNSGTKTITPNQRWSVLFMYYNAYDPDGIDGFGVIYEDLYTDQYSFTEGDYGVLDKSKTNANFAYWNYMTLQSGKRIGGESTISYTMPNITGDYYLVIYADAYNKITEVNEDNNFYFYTDANGGPLTFRNGVIQNAGYASVLKSTEEPQQFGNTKTQTAVNVNNCNAYTPTEIANFVKYHKEKGTLNQKVQAYRLKSATEQQKQRNN